MNVLALIDHKIFLVQKIFLDKKWSLTKCAMFSKNKWSYESHFSKFFGFGTNSIAVLV